MTKGRRTIVALLAVVAVLLGLNLLSDPPEAEAQAGGPVRLVSVTVTKELSANPDTYRVFRGWSNGDVDATRYRFDTGGVFGCGVLNQCGPVTIIP